MIVLHAAFEDSLLLWAESPTRQKGRLTAAIDAGAASLVSTAIELGLPLSKRHTREVVAWLPSSESGPIASAPLLAGEAPTADSGPLIPWIVMAASLEVGQSIPLLAACAGKRLLRPDCWPARTLLIGRPPSILRGIGDPGTVPARPEQRRGRISGALATGNLRRR